jgi:glutathione synthase/RimK-type ligase-like ATP-grasp enzyme
VGRGGGEAGGLRVRASRGSAREADERAAEQLRETSLLVQPFIAEVATEGEWSLLFFGGRFSHAVLKRPKPGDFRMQGDHGGSAEAASPPPRLVAAAKRALSRILSPWLYARVDGVESGGQFLLMELEMIEPYLFLGHAPHAAETFAETILGLPGRRSIQRPKPREASPETARAAER